MHPPPTWQNDKWPAAWWGHDHVCCPCMATLKLQGAILWKVQICIHENGKHSCAKRASSPVVSPIDALCHVVDLHMYAYDLHMYLALHHLDPSIAQVTLCWDYLSHDYHSSRTQALLMQSCKGCEAVSHSGAPPTW